MISLSIVVKLIGVLSACAGLKSAFTSINGKNCSASATEAVVESIAAIYSDKVLGFIVILFFKKKGQGTQHKFRTRDKLSRPVPTPVLTGSGS